MNSSKHISFIFLLLIGLGFSGWLYLDANKQNETIHDHSNTPDGIMENATMLRFDEQGQLLNRIQADKLTHFPGNDSTQIEKPNIILFKANAKPWTITAKQGLASEGSDVITLQKQVNIRQPAGPSNAPTVIKTEKLTYLPKQQLAKTDQFITLEQPGITVTSIGMKAHLDTSQIELLSEAKGKYQHG